MVFHGSVLLLWHIHLSFFQVCLVFALVLLAFSTQGLQHSLGRLSAVRNHVGIKTRTKKTRYHVSPETQASARWKKPAIHCSRSTLKYLGGIHEKKRNKGIGTRIGKANSFLCKLYRFMITNRSFQILRSRHCTNRYVSILTYVLTEVLYHLLSSRLILRHQVRSYEVRKAPNVELLLRNREISATLIRSCVQNAP